MPLADAAENPHELAVPVAGQLIGVPVFLMIFLPQAREVPVQLLIIILPVPLPQGHPHTEADDPPHLCPDAVFQDSLDILFGVVEEGQYGRKPHHRGDELVPQDFQHLGPPPGGAHIGLQDPAQLLVIGGQGHLHHAFRLLVDALQQIQVPEDPVGLGLYGRNLIG